MWSVLGLVGLAIIGCLAVVAVREVGALRRQNQAQKGEHQRLAAHCRDSIRVLSGSYLAGQIGGSEAGLRIATLLEQPSLDSDPLAEALRKQGEPFAEMAQAVQHIPTHAAWKALPPEQRVTYSREMEAAESSLAPRLETAAQAILKLM